jgi:hypothetical protein
MHLLKRVTHILTLPDKDWTLIKEEADTPLHIFYKYVMILAAIPSLAFFFRIGAAHLTVAFFIAAATYILNLIGIFALTMIMNVLSPSFHATKNLPLDFKIIAYSMIPFWLSGVFHLVSFLSLAGAIAGGFYFLYLLILGVGELKDVPREKHVLFSVIVALFALAFYLIIYLLFVTPVMVMTTKMAV